MGDKSVETPTSFPGPGGGKMRDPGNEVVETLRSKIRFSGVVDTSPPPSPQSMLMFYFLDSIDHSTYTHFELGSRNVRQLTLFANEIE